MQQYSDKKFDKSIRNPYVRFSKTLHIKNLMTIQILHMVTLILVPVQTPITLSLILLILTPIKINKKSMIKETQIQPKSTQMILFFSKIPISIVHNLNNSKHHHNLPIPLDKCSKPNYRIKITFCQRSSAKTKIKNDSKRCFRASTYKTIVS